MILLIFGYFIIFINGIFNRHRDETNLDAKIVYIDKSHMERFNFDQWETNGLGGTILCFLRSGYFPLQLDHFDEERLARSKILLLVSPAKPFSKREIEIMGKYIEQGGFVILSCGWEESASVKDLIDRLNVKIQNIPLGKLEGYQNSSGLSIPNAWSVDSKDGDGEVLTQSSGYPVILFRRINRGGLCLIGDSNFFLNYNIEAIYSYNINNILFFRNLLQKINN